ncbi:hypothetical protein D3C80_878760 [compost metagenome]
MSHAMPGTVIVIKPQLPQRTTCKRVQLMPLRPRRELQRNERQKAFKHGGVMQTLLCIELAVGQRARRIGGAVMILPT